MVGSASIFFGVLFLFMSGLWVIDYKLTHVALQPGGDLWWCMYVTFFLGWLILGCIKLHMPVKIISEEDTTG
jgi:hypothetical protein